ncbi:MAG: hypothetical protein U1C74_23895 [Phenylobacterium sp.]|nr:hypothetical protein [Phenylobacterium sp.]
MKIWSSARSHSQMPQRAASTAMRKRCSESVRIAWMRATRRTSWLSTRISPATAAIGPRNQARSSTRPGATWPIR